jgi:NAD+ diphosphatase
LPPVPVRRVIPLTGEGLDRAAHHRRDPAWLDAAFAADNVRILLMKDGLPLVEGSGPPTSLQAVGQAMPSGRPLLWLGAQAAMLAPKASRLFLGETAKGAPVFALDMPASFNLSTSPIAGLGVFEDFRVAATAMGAFDGGAAATARALFEWHHRHGFCSFCGAQSEVQEAGWKRKCPECGTEHFPRTDPVVIMLVVKEGKALMGRQAAWRPGFWSCLAGFVEPGETLEQAAAREVLEESGIRCSGVADYLFCQPWPFPSSLMVGMILEAETDDVTVDTSELESARWFGREEVAAMMAGKHPEAFGPMPIAIAHHVVMAWLERS